MRPELETKLGKIRRFSQILRRICRVMLAILSLLLVACVTAICVGGNITITSYEISLPVRSLVFYQRALLALVAAFGIGVGLKGLYHLERLFGDFARGEIFTTGSATQIRQLGLTAVLWAAANFIWVGTVYAFEQQHLHHSFYFHADSIVIGATVVVVSWFMEMAAEMHEENELTI